MKKKSELILQLLCVLSDYFAVVIGFVLAFVLREAQAKPLAYLIPTSRFGKEMILLGVIWIFIFAFLGLYSLSTNRSRINEFSRILAGSAIATTILILIDFFVSEPLFPSKAVPVYGLIISVLLITTFRLVLHFLQHVLLSFGIGTYNCLIIGSGPQRIELARALKNQSKSYKIVKNTTINSVSKASLQSVVNEHNIDDIFFVDNNSKKELVNLLLLFCRQNQIQLHIVPSINELYGTQLRSARINNMTLLEVVATPLDGWGRILKRIVDIVLSFVFAIITLPVFIAIGLVILVTDFGPIFYSHERLSRSGKQIRLFKFRTMKQKYCTGSKFGYKTTTEALKSFGDPKILEEFKKTQKVKNDPRISMVGRFLRATSLDELPQIYNVIIGQMSFVGPRPIIKSELDRYGDEAGLFLHIKPGLTGLWQVSGRTDMGYEQRTKLDIYYIENWSLGLDTAIILKTVPTVIFKKGGY